MHLSSSNAINHEKVFLSPFNLFSDNTVDDEFRFNDAGHLSQNGILTWFSIEMVSHTCMKT